MKRGMYIDIHTHTYYEDPETVVLLNIFADQEFKPGLPVYKSVGLHPWHIQNETWKQHVSAVESAMKVEGVIAVGEAGLDKKIKTDYSIQQEAFKGQLNIAQSYSKPLIIHCVRSYSEMLSHRKQSDQKIPWIFHWFNSDIQIARELIRKNCYLSFGHMLFNEQSRAFQVFRELPPDRIFFETDDAGYSIQEVYERGSSLLNIQITDLKARIMDNFTDCFHI